MFIIYVYNFRNNIIPAVVNDWSEGHWFVCAEEIAKSIPLDVLVRISKYGNSK